MVVFYLPTRDQSDCVSFHQEKVQVYLWNFRRGNIVFLINQFFDLTAFTTLTLWALLFLCRLLLPIVGLKISSLSTFALKSPIKFVCGTCILDRMHALVPYKCWPLYYHAYPHLVHVQQNHTNSFTVKHDNVKPKNSAS